MANKTNSDMSEKAAAEKAAAEKAAAEKAAAEKAAADWAAAEKAAADKAAYGAHAYVQTGAGAGLVDLHKKTLTVAAERHAEAKKALAAAEKAEREGKSPPVSSDLRRLDLGYAHNEYMEAQRDARIDLFDDRDLQDLAIFCRSMVRDLQGGDCLPERQAQRIAKLASVAKLAGLSETVTSKIAAVALIKGKTLAKAGAFKRTAG